VNPRLAAVLLVGFIATLVFLYAMSARKTRRTNELLSSQRERIEQYQDLVGDIQTIARGATDIDPSAELILMEIRNFKKKELQ
jgi:type II secretory pathway pseudopilin PulG